MKTAKSINLLTIALALVVAPFAASAGTSCITDVMVVGGADKSVTNSYASQGWKVIPQDLNAGAKGDYIYLLYKSASVENAASSWTDAWFPSSTSTEGIVL